MKNPCRVSVAPTEAKLKREPPPKMKAHGPFSLSYESSLTHRLKPSPKLSYLHHLDSHRASHLSAQESTGWQPFFLTGLLLIQILYLR